MISAESVYSKFEEGKLSIVTVTVLMDDEIGREKKNAETRAHCKKKNWLKVTSAPRLHFKKALFILSITKPQKFAFIHRNGNTRLVTLCFT